MTFPFFWISETRGYREDGRPLPMKWRVYQAAMTTEGGKTEFLGEATRDMKVAKANLAAYKAGQTALAWRAATQAKTSETGIAPTFRSDPG